MAEAMLDKLIEAVKSLKDGSDSQSEATIDRLFPSIGTSRGSIASSRQKDGNALSRFNSNVNYAPKRRKRNGPSTSSSTISCKQQCYKQHKCCNSVINNIAYITILLQMSTTTSNY
jgi:hypothetical protein